MHAAMAELGFRKQGRVYVNDTTAISVEFPAGPLSVGDEHITNTVYKQVAGGRIPILCVEDIVKDRLAAFMHWQDQQSLIQAVAVMLKHQLAPAQFRRFCEKEGANSNINY